MRATRKRLPESPAYWQRSPKRTRAREFGYVSRMLPRSMAPGIHAVCVDGAEYLPASMRAHAGKVYEWSVGEHMRVVGAVQARNDDGVWHTTYMIAYRIDRVRNLVASMLRICALNAALNMAVVVKHVYYNVAGVMNFIATTRASSTARRRLAHLMSLTAQPGVAEESVMQLLAVTFEKIDAALAPWARHTSHRTLLAAHYMDAAAGTLVMQQPPVYISTADLVPFPTDATRQIGEGESARVYHDRDAARVLKVYGGYRPERGVLDTSLDAMRETLGLLAARAERERPGGHCDTAELLGVALNATLSVHGLGIALVETYVDGSTLTDPFELFDRYYPDQTYAVNARALCIAAARAFADLERAGVAVVDLYGKNIHVDRAQDPRDPDAVQYRVRVIDFGTDALYGRQRVADPPQAAEGYEYFTPLDRRTHTPVSRDVFLDQYQHVPPECIEGPSSEPQLFPGARTDVWGLARLVLHIVSREMGKRRSTPRNGARYRVQTTYGDVLTPAMDALLRECFCEEPACRPSMQSVLDQLVAFDASEYVLQRPAP